MTVKREQAQVAPWIKAPWHSNLALDQRRSAATEPLRSGGGLCVASSASAAVP
jgi:hypothetical protein